MTVLAQKKTRAVGWRLRTRCLRALVCCAAVVLGGCKPRSKSELPQQSEAVPALPDTVHVLVDTSASMGGYFSGPSELKATAAAVAAMLGKLQGQVQPQIKTVRYGLVGEDGTPEETNMDTTTFIRTMRGGELMQHTESLLQNTLGAMVNKGSNTGVWLLITDSIVSYSDAEIRKNRRVNIDNEASLGSEVESAFSRAAGQGKGALLLAGLSSFHGRYFDYSNQPSACCLGKRPFYIWMIGPAGQVQALASTFRAERVPFLHEIAFRPIPTRPEVFIIERFATAGVFYRSRHRDQQGAPENNVLEAKQFTGGQPIQFAVAADLRNLPASMQDPAYLRKHLHVSDPEHALQLTRVAAFQEVEDKVAAEMPVSSQHSSKSATYTHVLFFTLSPAAKQDEVADVTLGQDLPDWYIGWSNDDDSRTSTATVPSTFGLRYLVEGVAGAFADTKQVIHFTLAIRR